MIHAGVNTMARVQNHMSQMGGQAMPAAGTLPPGTHNLTLILGWATGLAGLALLAGFTISMGKTGLTALRHGSFEGGMGAVVCLVCGVMLTASGAIFGALGLAAPA